MIKDKRAIMFSMIFGGISLLVYFVFPILPYSLETFLTKLSWIPLIIPNFFSWWLIAFMDSYGVPGLTTSSGEPLDATLTSLTIVSSFLFGYGIGKIFKKKNS